MQRPQPRDARSQKLILFEWLEHLHKSLGWAAPLVLAKWARNLILWQIKFVLHIAQIFHFDTQVFWQK